jgi:hypothetical protein
MPSIVLPRATPLIEIGENGRPALATEPHAWCMLAATDDVILSINPENPSWPYVLTFSTIEEVIAFRNFFAQEGAC